MAIWPLSQIGSLLVLLAAGALSTRLAATLLAVSVVASVVRYLRFTWRLEADALVIEQGLLQRQRRVIPLERVQSVDLVRPLRHRALGVVEVSVEAVGSGGTEGRLDALGVEDAQQLRALLLRGRQHPTPAPTRQAAHAAAPAEALLARLGPDRLVVAGLTGGRVGVAAAILGFLQQVFAERIDRLLQTAPALLGTRGLLALAVIALLGAFVLSVVATMVAYWDFTLSREGATLRVRRGLLEQRSDTLPLRRVQAVRVEENLVRRLLGLAAVKVDVAGRSGGEGRDSGTLLPLGRRAEAFALVEQVLDEPGLATIALAPMPRRARNRRIVRAVVVVALLTAGAVVLLGPLGLAALGLLVAAVPSALGSYQALGWGENDTFVVARAGLLVCRTAFVPKARLQSLELTANPLQRWRRLATVDLQIARSPGVWPGPQLIDLDRETASALVERLATTTARGDSPVPPVLAGREPSPAS